MITQLPGFLKRINAILDGDHSLIYDKDLYSGYFREVFFFTFYGRKFVLKVDRSEEVEEEPNGGCAAEAYCWETYKNTKLGKILAPVLAYGTNDRLDWLVMPELQLLHRVITNSSTKPEDYLRYTVLPKAKQFCPDMRWYYDRVFSKILGDDLHYNNWAMDNRGNWKVIDYSIGGN